MSRFTPLIWLLACIGIAMFVGGLVATELTTHHKLGHLLTLGGWVVLGVQLTLRNRNRSRPR